MYPEGPGYIKEKIDFCGYVNEYYIFKILYKWMLYPDLPVIKERILKLTALKF